MDRRDFFRKMVAPATAAIAIAASASLPDPKTTKVHHAGMVCCTLCYCVMDTSFRAKDHRQSGDTFVIARHYSMYDEYDGPRCPNEGKEFKIEMGIPAEICG